MGFCQGAFKQIANFAGNIVGLILAASLYSQFGDMLSDKTGASEGVADMVAFVLIAVVVPVALGWVASLFTKAFSAIHIGFLNRLAGAVIGAVCYGLVMSLAFNVFDFVRSSGGYKAEKLEERQEPFYMVKHASQIFVPDAIIVTDSTEVANGVEPKYGLKPVVDSAIDSAVDSVNPFK